jgi:hypothetical protein
MGGTGFERDSEQRHRERPEWHACGCAAVASGPGKPIDNHATGGLGEALVGYAASGSATGLRQTRERQNVSVEVSRVDRRRGAFSLQCADRCGVPFDDAGPEAMIDWNGWIPAIISLITALIILGGYLAVVREHGRRLDEHDLLHKETEKHDAQQDVALAKLEAWKDGYSAARATYDKTMKPA